MLTDAFFLTLVTQLRVAAIDASAFFIAVGTGLPEWDAALPTDGRAVTRLVNEIARTAVAAEDVVFLNQVGAPTEAPSMQLQVRAVFEAGTGTGTWRECGLFGGEVSADAGSGTLLSYFTHPRIEKSTGTTVNRTIRIDLTPRAVVAGTRETRYLANSYSEELHDLDNVTPNCQIDEIRFDRRYFFTDVEEASAAGYDLCAYCFGRELSVR